MMRVHACLLLLCCACRLVTAGMRVVLSPLDTEGSVSARVGGVVSLNCSAEGGGVSEQSEELEWHRNGQLLKLDPHNHFSPSRLCVQNVTTDDHQVTFTCHLKRNPTVAASAEIKVHFPPDLSGSEDVNVQESQDASLYCSVWAYPQVAVTWLRDDQPLYLVGQRRYTLYQDSREARLTITGAQRELHQGRYSCVTRSWEFGERSKTFHLLVEDKKMAFPLWPMVAAGVVVTLTAALAVVARWDNVSKCWK
ncbi:transmembrane and immunoglobulin domain-containing protein 1-like [Alosa sapidissima]|uniref:transmembrane and immunoglobulin domain-containing protein 1-like n=1 Tax=Alosa sapidissima TaxID=34773 RepID=UPI001C080EBC|nr:transmembrane and immunoglobulin domain-containing protein 1-like [Alosa sapidissima]